MIRHNSGDIYSGVQLNPSATLSPTSNTDPWDIREKPEIMLTTTELTMPPLPVEPLNTNDTNENTTSIVSLDQNWPQNYNYF